MRLISGTRMRIPTEKGANGRPYTLKDVARLAGVSTATVSRTLNDSAIVSRETRAKVLSAVTGLHYCPNANAVQLARHNGGIHRRDHTSYDSPLTLIIRTEAGPYNKSQIMERLRSLQDENARLKRLVAQLCADLETWKDAI